MTRPDRILQPGPIAPDRIVSAAGWGHRFSFEAQPGRLLLEEVNAGFRAAGFSSGVAVFSRLGLGPFGYVMPSTSPSPRNAAFYSAPYRPAGISRTICGSLTFGLRDDVPYFHAHALWQEADGRSAGGHILPEETIVAEPGTVHAIGLDGAGFVAAQDNEINFKVFGPVPAPRLTGADGQRCLAVRLRPNQDYASAIESLCRDHDIRNARVVGGVGSIIGAAFADGHTVEAFVTEIFLKSGSVSADASGEPVASLDIGLVDMNGRVTEGRLLRGVNPVLMTIELVIIEE